jgi:DNA-binding beta-propeller fold protein YncE
MLPAVRSSLWVGVLAMLCTSACGDDGSSMEVGSTDTDETDASTTGPELPARIMVTADWRAKTLSIVDFDALAAGASTMEEIVVSTIDLGAYEPGPLEVELTPDARTAVVSVSPGFYDGIVGNTIGISDVPLGGLLLVVDLVSGAITELQPAHVPMGIAISPDGTTAYTANYGHTGAQGTTLSLVDLTTLTVVNNVEVGPSPEQVSLSTDGALGIMNVAGDGTVVVFQTADPAGTMSTPLPTSSDPSDVDFIEGTDLAVVANSLNPAVYSVIDVSDPSAPTLLHEAEPTGGFPYGLTPIPGTTEFVMTIANQGISFLRVDAATDPPLQTWSSTLPEITSFPMGIAVAADAGLAISAAPGANVLVVLGLADGGSRTIPWLAETGPTYVAIQR